MAGVIAVPRATVVGKCPSTAEARCPARASAGDERLRLLTTARRLDDTCLTGRRQNEAAARYRNGVGNFYPGRTVCLLSSGEGAWTIIRRQTQYGGDHGRLARIGRSQAPGAYSVIGRPVCWWNALLQESHGRILWTRDDWTSSTYLLRRAIITARTSPRRAGPDVPTDIRRGGRA